MKAAVFCGIKDVRLEDIEIPQIKNDEACKRGGFGAEILSQVEESDAFDYLDVPIRRLGGKNIPIPYSAGLEKGAVPQEDDILKTARKLVE